MKGKRDAAIEGTPFSYEQPQKSYQVYTHQQQQKAAMVEYHQSPQKSVQVEYHQAPQKSVQVEYHQAAPQQKVAPLNHYEKLQAASLQAASHQNAHAQAAPAYAAALHVQPQEQHYEQAQQYQFPAGYGHSGGESLFANSPYKFEYNYVPSYEIEKMPAVHYSQDINNPFLGYSDYKGAQYSSYKPSSPYHQEYSFESPAPAHNFQSHSYLIPQQNEHLHQAYLAEYAAQGGAGQSAHYYGGFSQQPSAIFVPQTVSIPTKQTKVPDYASGLKGLGHYSTVSAIAAPAPTQSVHKQTYEAPSYIRQYSHSQTERPFKASAYLGSSPVGHDSYSEQSISNAKPSAQYLPPSKTYLPAKEQQHYVAPQKTYLPAKEQQIYVPAKEEQQYVSIKQQHHYVPSLEHYAPSKEYHYVPEQSPVEYQIEYIQAPAKNYLPAAPIASNYLPAKVEQPKASYLPPKKTYLPAQQPTSSYLPPSNPYQTSYHSSSQQAPAQQYQYQQQDSYESVEYQSVTPSGHK